MIEGLLNPMQLFSPWDQSAFLFCVDVISLSHFSRMVWQSQRGPHHVRCSLQCRFILLENCQKPRCNAPILPEKLVTMQTIQVNQASTSYQLLPWCPGHALCAMAEESCHGFAKYWETFLWSKKVWHGFTKKWFKIAEPGGVSLGSQLRMRPRRLKHVAALHLRQIPCFHAVGKPKLNRAEQSHWVWI